MKPVDQTDWTPKTGDCFRACVASIFELPIESVPNFMEEGDDHFKVDIGKTTTENTVRSQGIILASGRFIGGGLYADRQRIKETIFDLPVHQPGNRAEWHCRDMLDHKGHPVNRAGLEIDDSFRPLNSSHRPAFRTLLAAGSILAHNDWKRLKCGAGLAIASAFGAVKSFMRINK